MKYITVFIYCLIALSFVTAFEAELLQANIKSLDASVCIDDLKNRIKLVESLNNDLLQNNYKRVIDKMSDMNRYFNETIPKCADQFCWMNGQERCQYTVETECESINELWYPKCKSGYKIKEQSICVQECPATFKESGLLYCEKPESYYRGLGYTWKFGDKFGLDGARSRCAQENPQGCEQLSAVIFPKCQNNYQVSGCCSCKPNCPAEMKDNGVTCMRKQYARGFGHTNGQCVRDGWNQFTPISQFGECADQLKQLSTEISAILEKLSLESDKTMWDTLKQAYVLVQHAAPFIDQCTEAVASFKSNDSEELPTEETTNGWTVVFELIFKALQFLANFFKKE